MTVGQLKHGHAVRHARTPEYSAWCALIGRCTNPRNKGWRYYGGRGITVCERWRHDFTAFLADMGPRPSPNHSIDRFPDNDGNYEPGNARWATDQQQNANTRVTLNPLAISLMRHLRRRGEQVSAIAHAFGVSRSAVRYHVDDIPERPLSAERKAASAEQRSRATSAAWGRGLLTGAPRTMSIEVVRAIFLDPRSHKTIAVSYGTSATTVGNIKARRIYRDALQAVGP